MTADISPFAHLPSDLVEQVRAAVDAAAATDGTPPLSEAFLLDLPRSGRHLVASAGGHLLGYAQTAADGSVEALPPCDAV